LDWGRKIHLDPTYWPQVSVPGLARCLVSQVHRLLPRCLTPLTRWPSLLPTFQILVTHSSCLSVHVPNIRPLLIFILDRCLSFHLSMPRQWYFKTVRELWSSSQCQDEPKNERHESDETVNRYSLLSLVMCLNFKRMTDFRRELMWSCENVKWPPYLQRFLSRQSVRLVVVLGRSFLNGNPARRLGKQTYLVKDSSFLRRLNMFNKMIPSILERLFPFFSFPSISSSRPVRQPNYCQFTKNTLPTN
jgi:hypothetical protein